jgi:hypothetical protein
VIFPDMVGWVRGAMAAQPTPSALWSSGRSDALLLLNYDVVDTTAHCC